MKKLIWILTISFGLTIIPAAFNKLNAQTTTKYRKGWSHKKKDAVIGAGAGAVTGAVVSKNHAKGAIIGGAVGAGAGYMLGRHQDKEHPVTKRIYKRKTDRK